ncbi:zinc finger and BTB domain-containing protein 41-like [Spodoptera litura]|uniref:Zinc finger and BTB domain-containing protein 41-like n=1 Tax=Spodoptera litura TaxID=69820 RepID=A0A9J7ES19_SPOLT|nr:zinc finger and BTB domain-containing protein 41-like [Spodoptera litura]
MEMSVPLVEISVKPEPMEDEGTSQEDNLKQDNCNLRSEELWIKPEPLEDESQDSREGETSDNETGQEGGDEDLGKKENKDGISKLPLKKRLEKTVKQEDGCSVKEEDKSDGAEQNEKPAENIQAKMETPLMYSYEITKNIEIVTIDDEERHQEYLETLKSRQHMRHVCENCAVGFVLKQAYDDHMKVHAPESGEHECVICHSRLKTADMLYRHRLRHYRRYRCLLCRMRFKDKDTAACHVMNDHIGQTFECDRCGRGFKRPQYLKRHVEQYHTKPHRLECAVCLRVFHERGWYRSHIRTHNEEVKAKTVKLPATCTICSRDYKTKSSLKRHLLTHDHNSYCRICFVKCKNRITLGEHYLKEHNEKYEGVAEETCPHCERVCVTRAMLKRHIQRMHADRTKKYQCDHCQRLYLTKGEVRAHIMWSHMPAEIRGGHACPCGRIFRSPSLLRSHKARFHESQPPPRVHQCDHCDKAFANKQVLNRHKKSHSNEMYPCKECGLLFKTQPYVKVHYQLKHLNMTRAEIKAQRKLNKEKIIQNNIHNTLNWEPPPPISSSKGILPTEEDTDPLLLEENDGDPKMAQNVEIEIPQFQTFIDIRRE